MRLFLPRAELFHESAVLGECLPSLGLDLGLAHGFVVRAFLGCGFASEWVFPRHAEMNESRYKCLFSAPLRGNPHNPFCRFYCP